MSIDLSFHRGFENLLRSWIEGRGEAMILMQRFYSDLNQKTLGISTIDYCPRCADIDEDNVTDPNCFVCFGTGFEGGYGPPITGINSPYQRVYAIRKTDTIITSLQAEGIVSTQQEQSITFLTIPQPRYGDLLIDEQDNRYIIGNSVTDWQFNRRHIGWHATVSQQGFDSIFYKVPVPYLVQPFNPVYNDNLQLTLNDVNSLVLAIGDGIF